MFLGVLMLQEYPSGVYQTEISSPDTKIRLIQFSLNISDSLFASSDHLTLDLLLPPSSTTMIITVLDESIYYIPYT